MALMLFIFILQTWFLSESYVIWNDPLNDTNGNHITWTSGWDNPNVQEGSWALLTNAHSDCPTLNDCWQFIGNYFAYYIHHTLNYTNISLTLSVSGWGLETGTTDDFCGVYYSIDSTLNWVNIATWNDDDFSGNSITKTLPLPAETTNNIGIGIKLQSQDNTGNANDHCYFNDAILEGETISIEQHKESTIFPTEITTESTNKVLTENSITSTIHEYSSITSTDPPIQSSDATFFVYNTSFVLVGNIVSEYLGTTFAVAAGSISTNVLDGEDSVEAQFERNNGLISVLVICSIIIFILLLFVLLCFWKYGQNRKKQLADDVQMSKDIDEDPDLMEADECRDERNKNERRNIAKESVTQHNITKERGEIDGHPTIRGENKAIIDAMKHDKITLGMVLTKKDNVLNNVEQNDDDSDSEGLWEPGPETTK